jgi:hypothetical protein
VNSETTHPDKRKNGRFDPHLGDSFLSRIARRCLDVPPKQKANDPYDGFEDSPKSKVEGEGEGKPNHQIDRDDGEGVDHGFQASGAGIDPWWVSSAEDIPKTMSKLSDLLSKTHFPFAFPLKIDGVQLATVEYSMGWWVNILLSPELRQLVADTIM